MSRLKVKPHVSVEDYLASERDADVRHEYVDGRPLIKINDFRGSGLALL